MHKDTDPDDDLPLDESEDADLDDPDRDDPDRDDLDPYEGRWDEGRSVFVICARQPFEDWVRGVSGKPPEWRLPPIARCHGFLTPELPTQADSEEWLRQNYLGLFEGRFDEWTEDESQWPADRSFETFRDWFDVVFAPAVDDMADETVRDGDVSRERVPRQVTCAPLSLRQVCAEFLALPADSSLHVEASTGELFAWTDDELEAIHAGDAQGYGVDADDMRELQEVFASESLIEIAHRADVDNTDTMVAFVATVESPRIRNRLVAALQGKKPRRRFTQAIDVAGLRHRWSAWFERTSADMLREFMKARGVPFVDDVETQEPPAEG